MANDIDVTPGTGATVAADEVGGKLHQLVKLVIGPDGAASRVNNANPIPISDAGGSVTVDGTVAVSAVGGTVAVTDNGGSLTVDGTVDVASVGGSVAVTGTFWQATQPVSDAGGALTVDDGGGSLTIDGTVTIDAVAHDAADSGNPIKIGARARSSEIAAVSNNDRSDLLTDLVGKLLVLPYSNPENFVSGAITSAMAATTSTSLLAAPASGLRNYITTIVVSNAHATVGTDVIIQDGSGGTTLLTIPAAAVYGGAVINLPVPLRQPTTATAIFCANVTTGASTKVSAVGYKGV